uniref:Uncharacterized protein n=1 Tax=Anguilla anguilla TaxID=7936 RepID=A0A0E9U421_ANGAN
MILYNDVKLQ